MATPKWLQDAIRIIAGTPEGVDPRLQYGMPMPGAGAVSGAAGRIAGAGSRASGAARSGASQAKNYAQTVTPRQVGRAGAGVLGTAGAVGTTRAMGAAGRRDPRPVGSPGTGGIGPGGDPRMGSGGARFSPAQRRKRREAQEAQSSGVRAPTMEEERRTVGAPGQGGFADPRLGGLFEGQGQGQAAFDYEDPYAEFLQSHYNDLASSYDDQIAAIAGLDPISRNLAAESQENIGEFFDYAGDVAREGIPVTEDIYDTATQNVEGIYDDLGGRLEGMPGKLTDIASEAAGGSVGSSVAGRVSAATAPFMAAGESARANATSNLAQHSAAGQNYLNQLAGATGGEGAMHQSHVQGALDQQLQHIAFKEAEMEGAKQRALSEVSADIAGESAERMGNAALAHALGLDLPGGGAINPMDYLQGQGMMQDLAGESGDPLDPLRQEAETHQLLGAIDPTYESSRTRQAATQDLSPVNMQALDLLQSKAEAGGEAENPREIGMAMLHDLDEIVSGFNENENWTPDTLGGQEIPAAMLSGPARQQLQQAIRQIYLNQ